MGFDQVKSGKDVPNDINVIIEISAQGEPIKFEVDKDSSCVFVDRFMGTSMRYPCNYGY
ncbi:MAG: inorganic diphosphatase, partial [Zoogloeaceae bacterium]|nr:inorganic diphosphatase [Zoogloeaceae bacterium]